MRLETRGAGWSPARSIKLSSVLRERLSFCRENAADLLFLDIETTGLSHYYDEITVIGWSFAGRVGTLVKGEDPSPFLRDAKRAKGLVTFNGIRFDARFLRQELAEIVLPELHIDLMYLCRRVGLTGGQKAIERTLNLKLRDDIEDVDGFAAVLLWHQYLRGDREALQRLIRYNRTDIAAMGKLFDEAVSRLMFADDLFSIGTSFFDYSAPRGWTEAPPATKLPAPKFLATTYDILFAKNSVRKSRIVGIDLTGSEARGSGWCLLKGKKAVTDVVFSDADLIERTVAAKPDLVSIDSPLSLPAGRISVDDSDPGRDKYGIMRVSERELKRRGINVYPCLLPSMQKLTARGIRFANELRRRGIPVIESYPGAAQDIMRIPRKGAGEKWLKTGLAEFGIEGLFRTEKVTHDELDAITSALVGTFHLAGMTEALGTKEEAPLIIPMLKSKATPFVVGISGPIGSGKTTLARLLEEQGFAYTRFSQVLDDLLKQQGEPLTRENRQRLGQEVNETGRQRWLAEQALERVGGADRIVVDGLRFPEDHAFLVERFGNRFHHVYVETSADKRQARSPQPDSTLSAAVEQAIPHLRTLASDVVPNDGDAAALRAKAEALAKLA
jgi:predicted nuclease with RNAse H fold/dephospho-CoA kinase